MLNHEYIVRIIETSAHFGFHTNQTKVLGKKLIRLKIPVFSIILPFEERDLLNNVCSYLGLAERVYTHQPYTKDGIERSPRSILHIRSLGSMKNIIMPFLCKNLQGVKLRKMDDWLNEIETSEFINESYKLVPRLYKSGYWS